MGEHKVAVITGANGYLGIAIAERLISHLRTDTRLTIVVTSRTLPGVKQAVAKIKSYVSKHPREALVEFDYLVFDQCSKVSMLSAAHDLRHRFAHIDYLFLNSSYAIFKGVDYKQAFIDFLKEPIVAFSKGDFKIQGIGKKSSDGVGSVYQANILSPWYLINELLALLKGGRVIWISSCISVPQYFDPDDVELLQCAKSYETAKYEIELLHRATYEEMYRKHDIQQWVVQPGVFKSTSFVPTLNIFAYLGMVIMFYVCRWFGSPYHCIWPEPAANAPVWAALNADPESDDMRLKHGSSTTRLGHEKLIHDDMGYLAAEHVREVYEHTEHKREEWKREMKDQIIERHLY